MENERGENMTPEEKAKLEELKRGGFHPDTCFSCVDSAEISGGGIAGTEYKIAVFIEPAGIVTKTGKSWVEVLDWWLTVLKTQPKNSDYISAGWWLIDQFEEGKLPDDPTKVWDGLPEQLEREYIARIKGALREVAEVFKRADRIGADDDNPEGARHIQISDTLANKMAKEIEALLERGSDDD